MLRRKFFYILISILILLNSSPLWAAKEDFADLKEISLCSGVNKVPFHNPEKDAQIIHLWRANNETAHAYNIFLLSIAEEGKIPRIIPIHTGKGTMDYIADDPHDGELSSMRLRFAEGVFKDKKSTYLIIASHPIPNGYGSETLVTFNIYQFYAADAEHNPVSANYYLELIDSFQSKKPYVNMDTALHDEFGFVNFTDNPQMLSKNCRK